MPRTVLAGGWGYENLGDEAILAGYVEALGDDVTIASVDTGRTARSQRRAVGLISERELARTGTDRLVLGGGGYLNGSWVPEVNRKLGRLTAGRGDAAFVTHAVEVRGLTGSARASRLFAGGTLSVRDAESQGEVQAIAGVTPTIAPDAISLLWPHLDRYGTHIPELSEYLVVNLLDVARRPDSGESEIEPRLYDSFFASVVEEFRGRVLGLVVGEGDLKFMRKFPELPLVEPASVGALVSVLRSARAVMSVRMHPALIASGLGTSTISLPYCGKVRPTLERIGVDPTILAAADLDRVRSVYERDAEDYSAAWQRAHTESRTWLLDALTG